MSLPPRLVLELYLDCPEDHEPAEGDTVDVVRGNGPTKGQKIGEATIVRRRGHGAAASTDWLIRVRGLTVDAPRS